jgi:DegV family protein with EDD domain
MQNVAIVTDGSCDLPKDLIDKYKISIAPFQVIFDTDVYQLFGDSGELTKEEFYDRLEKGPNMPTTAIPKPKSFMDAFEAASKLGDSVIAIFLSKELSGTIQSATRVLHMLEEVDITIVDSKVSASCLGLLVLEAAKMAVDGATKEEILTELDNLIPQANLVVVVDTMEYLYRGGRIGRAKKLFGQALNIKPILHFEDGVVSSGGTIRGRDEVIRRLKFMAKFIAKNSITNQIFIWHTRDLEIANDLKEIINQNKTSNIEVRTQEAGPVIGTHVGPKSLGFTYIGSYNKNWLLKMTE